MGKIKKIFKENFTTVSNDMYRDSRMGIAERGLLGTMLSLPDNWNFSITGLASILPNGESSVKNNLKRLEELGYLKRERIYENGKVIDWEYSFSDTPMFLTDNEKAMLDVQKGQLENLDGENLQVENLLVENLLVENQLLENLDVEKPHMEDLDGENLQVENLLVENQHVENLLVENQHVENLLVENQHVENLHVENRRQLNTNKLNTNKLNNSFFQYNNIFKDYINNKDFIEMKERIIKNYHSSAFEKYNLSDDEFVNVYLNLKNGYVIDDYNLANLFIRDLINVNRILQDPHDKNYEIIKAMVDVLISFIMTHDSTIKISSIKRNRNEVINRILNMDNLVVLGICDDLKDRVNYKNLSSPVEYLKKVIYDSPINQKGMCEVRLNNGWFINERKL